MAFGEWKFAPSCGLMELIKDKIQVNASDTFLSLARDVSGVLLSVHRFYQPSDFYSVIRKEQFL